MNVAYIQHFVYMYVFRLFRKLVAFWSQGVWNNDPFRFFPLLVKRSTHLKFSLTFFLRTQCFAFSTLCINLCVLDPNASINVNSFSFIYFLCPLRFFLFAFFYISPEDAARNPFNSFFLFFASFFLDSHMFL